MELKNEVMELHMSVLALVIFLLCLARWIRFIKRKKIESKYFRCTIISTIIYWGIIGLIVLFESRINMLTLGILSILFYFVSFALVLKRMYFFLDIMQKYYPSIMREFNASRDKYKFKRLRERLVEIKEDCLPVVSDAILKRESIKPTIILHYEIIFCTVLFLFPDRIC